jgi:hypothetical protein
MKTNGKHEVIARITWPGLVLAALLAMVLAGSVAGRAQSSATSPTVPAAAPTNAAPASQAALPAAPSERKPGGNHEGITVHGHWTIEVRNPDGKLVSHREFENALVPTLGAEQLTYLLLGSTVPGGYSISMTDSSGNRGPCPALQSFTGCFLIGSLISPEPAGFGDNSSGCGGTGFTYQIIATGPCFPLSISASSGTTGLVFSGTAVASTIDSITDVSLEPIICPFNRTVTTSSPGSGTASPNACASGQAQAANTFPLTHATLPTPVQISAVGQFISVNVQISFQ